MQLRWRSTHSTNIFFTKNFTGSFPRGVIVPGILPWRHFGKMSTTVSLPLCAAPIPPEDIVSAKLKNVKEVAENVSSLIKKTTTTLEKANEQLSKVVFCDADRDPDKDEDKRPEVLIVQDAINGYCEATQMAENELATIANVIPEMNLTVRKWITFRHTLERKWWDQFPKHSFGKPSVSRGTVPSIEGVSTFIVWNDGVLTALTSARVGKKYTFAGFRFRFLKGITDPVTLAEDVYRRLRPNSDSVFPVDRDRDFFFIDSFYPLVDVTHEGVCTFATGVGLAGSQEALFLSGYRLAEVPLSAFFTCDESTVECCNIDCLYPEACSRFMKLNKSKAAKASWCNPQSDRAVGGGGMRKMLVPNEETNSMVVVDMNDTAVQSEWLDIKLSRDHGMCLYVLGGWGLTMAIPGHRLRCTLLSRVQSKQYESLAPPVEAIDEEKVEKYIKSNCNLKLAKLFEHIKSVQDLDKRNLPLIVTPVYSSVDPTATRYHLEHKRFWLCEFDTHEDDFVPTSPKNKLESGIPEHDPILSSMLDTETLKAGCGSNFNLSFSAVGGVVNETLHSLLKQRPEQLPKVETRYKNLLELAAHRVADKKWTTEMSKLFTRLLREEAAASVIAAEVTKGLVDKTIVGLRIRKLGLDNTTYLTGTSHDTGILSYGLHGGKLSSGITKSAVVPKWVRKTAVLVRQWLASVTSNEEETPKRDNILPPSMTVNTKAENAEFVDRLVAILQQVSDPVAFLHCCGRYLDYAQFCKPSSTIPLDCSHLTKRENENSNDGALDVLEHNVKKLLEEQNHNLNKCGCSRTTARCPWVIPKGHWMIQMETDRQKRRNLQALLTACHLKRAKEEENARKRLYWTIVLSVLIESVDSCRATYGSAISHAMKCYCQTVVRNRILDNCGQCNADESVTTTALYSRVEEMASYILSSVELSASLQSFVHNAIKWTTNDKDLKERLAEYMGFGVFSAKTWIRDLCLGVGMFATRGLSVSFDTETKSSPFAFVPIPDHVSAPQLVPLHPNSAFSSAGEMIALVNVATGSAVLSLIPSWVAQRNWVIGETRDPTPTDALVRPEVKVDRLIKNPPNVPLAALCKPKVLKSNPSLANRNDIWSALILIQRSAWRGKIFGSHTDGFVTAHIPLLKDNKIKCSKNQLAHSSWVATAALSMAWISNISAMYGPGAVSRVLEYEAPVDVQLIFADKTAVDITSGNEANLRLAAICPVPGSTEVRSSALTSAVGPLAATVPYRRFMFGFHLYGQKKRTVPPAKMRTPKKSVGANSTRINMQSLSRQLMHQYGHLEKLCVFAQTLIEKQRAFKRKLVGQRECGPDEKKFKMDID